MAENDLPIRARTFFADATLFASTYKTTKNDSDLADAGQAAGSRAVFSNDWTACHLHFARRGEGTSSRSAPQQQLTPPRNKMTEA